MIKKINIFLVLLLLILSVSAVSAADDGDIMAANETASDIVASASDEILASDVTDDELSAPATYVVDSSTYSTYFSGGKLSPSVKDGDTLKIDGSFNGKDFVINKTVNVVGTSTNNMKNCIFTFYEGASGSTVSDLKIANTKDYSYGVFFNGASNCVIQNCIINNTGQSSYTICVANNANYNNVSNNVLYTYGKTYGHSTRSTPPLLLCNAHYNYIGDNDVYCDDANAIYLSSYEGGPLKGGESTFNTIYNNRIQYNVLPTSWAYGIQVMGKNNTISSNTIIGAYRGISTSNAGNVIIDNWIVNLTGADYNNPGEETGGEIAIVGSYNSTIKNNHIVNAKVIGTGAGISALDNSVIENNIVEVTLQGKGVYPRGSNITIKDNTITTNSGSGVLYDSASYNLAVIANNITSNTGVGVLIQKVSNKRMPGNITIVDNTIATKNKYAIDALEADANSTNVIEGNTIIGGGLVRTPEGSYDPSKPAYNFNGTVHYITPDNYCDYINEDGGLSPDIKTGDILYFSGEFYDKIIKINAPIKITGDNPTFYNTTFRVACDGVWIENLTIRNEKASRVDAWGVVIYQVAGATVTNCDIKVYDPQAAYAIYAVESSDVDIINNKLYSSGDYLTYTLLIYAVEDGKFINNTIDTLGTGQIHQWEQEHCIDGDTNCLDGDTFCLDGDENCLDGDSLADGNHMLSEVYRTYGILMAYSSDNVISGNKVKATSKLTGPVSPYNSTNSIVGIDAYFNCQNNVFSDNEVYVSGYDNYLYGMGVLGYTTGHTAPEGQGAINDQFINNYINVEGTYCVTGIIIGDETTDTIIEDNIINLKSDKVSYGITLEMSQKSTIKDNYASVNSDVIYGIEALSSSDNTINGNEFEFNGKQVYGILFSNGKSNSVIGNDIVANGTGEKLDFKVLDSMPAGNGGIYLKSNSSYNEIRENNIKSAKEYAVLVDDIAVNNVITDNCLVSEKGIGDAGVNITKNNVVENNYGYTFKGKMTSMKADYLDIAKLTLTIDTDGALVKFYIKDDEVGTAVSSNGAATLEYPIDESLVPGTYKVKTVASKENYRTEQYSANLKVNKGNLDVELDDVSAKLLSEANFTATVTDALGRPVSGVNVKFYRNQGRDVYVGEAATGADGVARLATQIPSISGNSFVISANVSGDSRFNDAGGQATLYILKDNSIQIEIKDITVVYNDGKDLVAVIKDDKGNAVGGINLNVRLNGADSTVTSDKDGKATISLAGLVPNTYTANVAFPGNDVYGAASASAKVTVIKAESKLTANYDSGSQNIVATVKDTNGNPIAGINVGFDIDGVKYVVSDANGVAKYSIADLAKKAYAVNVMAYANELYGDSNKETVTFDLSKISTTLAADDVVATYNSGKKLVATLKDANGKAIGGAKVTVKVGDVTKTLTTDANGQVSLTTDGLTPNTYTANIAFDGDDVYSPSSATAKVVINKVKTNLAAKYENGVIVATVKDADGNPVSGLKVGFALNGVKYAVTDANGQAEYAPADLAEGTHTVKVIAYGNEIYEDSNQENVVVKKTQSKIFLRNALYFALQTKIVQVTLWDGDNKPLAGKTVHISLDEYGLKYSGVTDENGDAYIRVGVGFGVHQATVSFDGDGEYGLSTRTGSIRVIKETPSVMVRGVDSQFKASTNPKIVKVHLRDRYDKPLPANSKIVIKVNGQSFVGFTDANGIASIKITLNKKGTYNAQAVYGGNSAYNAVTRNIKIYIK